MSKSPQSSLRKEIMQRKSSITQLQVITAQRLEIYHLQFKWTAKPVLWWISRQDGSKWLIHALAENESTGVKMGCSHSRGLVFETQDSLSLGKFNHSYSEPTCPFHDTLSTTETKTGERDGKARIMVHNQGNKTEEMIRGSLYAPKRRTFGRPSR